MVRSLPAGGARENEEVTPHHGVHQRPEAAAQRSRRDRPPINESTIQQPLSLPRPPIPSRAPRVRHNLSLTIISNRAAVRLKLPLPRPVSPSRTPLSSTHRPCPRLYPRLRHRSCPRLRHRPWPRLRHRSCPRLNHRPCPQPCPPFPSPIPHPLSPSNSPCLASPSSPPPVSPYCPPPSPRSLKLSGFGRPRIT